MTGSIGDAVESYSGSCIETDGDYKTEDEAKAAFVAAFTKTECFNIYAEVDCWYFGGSVFGDKPTGRIDFVMIPRKPLLEKGWLNGCVGVEVKKSGHKVGPLICQMMDYSKAIFRLPDACGRSLICLTAVFCFPSFSSNNGAIQSIMSNNRLGFARAGKWDTNLLLNSTNIFSHGSRGLFCSSTVCGLKNGSR